ncbi:MAG: poly(R)-hydroxyalkanoic acid synthase subunit PhaE [Desulfobacteraceae bacterium]|jgi:class III poly(R)-hydroxyalkanoic acid synthase PhaE subunit
MNEKGQEGSEPETLLAAWMRSAADFWGSMAQMWPGVAGAFEKASAPPKGDKGRMQESWESALRIWQTFSSSFAEPEAVDNLSKGISALPEILMKVTKTGWDAYFQMQQQWMERAGRIGKSTEAYKFENIDQEAFRSWLEIYDKEFRQFLKVPQLGLTRFYQERMAGFLDKLNLFQGAMAEFMYLIYMPMEKSSKVMQEKIEGLIAEGELPENSQDYYRMWLKTLEGHYMTLFKSSEYTQVLSNTLNALEEYTGARQQLLQDMMQMLQMPTNKEMDDLYKEIYELKRKVKQLEKKSKKSGVKSKK